MHVSVDYRRRKLFVPWGRSAFAELYVGREDYAPSLITVENHLEQQLRAFDID